MSKDYTLGDFRRQFIHAEKMGIKNLLDKMPGLTFTNSGAKDPDLALQRIRRMLDAMTDEERNNPDLIDTARRTRIAISSGTQAQDVESFLAQFQQVRAEMRHIGGQTH